jgi:hypothetical protein
VRVVDSFGGEQEPAQLAPAKSALLARMHGRTTYVLGWVGRDPPVDVRETVETAGGRQTRSIVDAASPRSSIEMRYSSR